MHRRHFLFGASAALGALTLPNAAKALSASGERKFIFVFNPGGWDTTRVFAPTFGSRFIDMERDATVARAGGLSYVDHSSRPSVRAFFETHHARTLVLNGVMVRSIAHEICSMIMMTGSSSGLAPDWPAILGHHAQPRPVLPSLVLDGPSFPGDLGVSVARTGTGGQLDALMTGSVHDWSDQQVRGPTRPTEHVVDRYLLRRAEARAQASVGERERALTHDLHTAMKELNGLKDLRYQLDLATDGSLEAMSRVAAQALSLGVSRSVTLAFTGGAGAFGWDSHADNDTAQSTLFEGLFQGLLTLMATLKSTPGQLGGTLADETTVVVLSEMGRTPKLNNVLGKDHWPYTSAMFIGPFHHGDHVVGGFDDTFTGLPTDPSTGDPFERGELLSAEAVGATILAMADVDPEPFVSGVRPLQGLLR